MRRDLIARNAVLLEKMQADELYKDILGDPDGQWAGYLSDLEIFYTRSRVHQLTTLYKRLTLKLRIPEGAWAQVPLTRLMDALPVIDANNWDEWFSKAITLTTRDWNIELRQAKGLTSEVDEHEHDDVDYKICTRCGRKEKHTHDTQKDS